MNDLEFGMYLKKCRKEKKLTVRQLDLYSGVSHSYISQMERGIRGIPSPDVLNKLSKPLGITYEELMKKAGYIKEDVIEEIKTFDEDSKKLSIEDLFEKYSLTLDGREFTEQEFKNFIAFLRAHRSLGQDI